MTSIELRKKYNKSTKDFDIKDYVKFLEKIALSYSQDILCDKLNTLTDYEYAVYLENRIIVASWSL